MQEKKIQWQEVFELCRKCFIKHYQDKICKRSKFNGKKFANCVENVSPSIFRTKYTREVNSMARSFPIVQKMFYGALLGQSMQEKKIQRQEIFVFILILFLLIINNALGFSVIVILSKMMLIKVFEILLSKFIKLLIHCKVLTILNILFWSSFEFLFSGKVY